MSLLFREVINANNEQVASNEQGIDGARNFRRINSRRRNFCSWNLRRTEFFAEENFGRNDFSTNGKNTNMIFHLTVFFVVRILVEQIFSRKLPWSVPIKILQSPFSFSIYIIVKFTWYTKIKVKIYSAAYSGQCDEKENIFWWVLKILHYSRHATKSFEDIYSSSLHQQIFYMHGIISDFHFY